MKSLFNGDKAPGGLHRKVLAVDDSSHQARGISNYQVMQLLIMNIGQNA
jgi:hypothetical protein